MDRQPVLQGQLLQLRPLRREDFDDLYAVASEPLIREQNSHRNRYQEEIFREIFGETHLQLSVQLGPASDPIANDVKPKQKMRGKLLLIGAGLVLKAMVKPCGNRAFKLYCRP